jgi:hypothetical protein
MNKNIKVKNLLMCLVWVINEIGPVVGGRNPPQKKKLKDVEK